MISEELALYGRPLSARDAEQVLGIPAGTVRSWFARKGTTQLWDMGRDSRNNPMFWEVDLLVLRAGKRIRDSAGQRMHTMMDLL